MAATVSGVILYYLESKHYGRIERNHRQYFFHRNDIEDIKAKGDPLDGQFVLFEETSGARGPKAIHITRVPETSSEIRYELAKGFNVYHRLVGEQKNLLLAVADWTVTMRDKGSCTDIKSRLYKEVRRLGANGILDEPKYEQDEERDYLNRNHISSVYSYRVRPCLIGKKSSKGLRFEELAGLNARIEAEFNKSEPEDSRTDIVTKLTIAAGLVLVIIGLPTVYLSIFGVILIVFGTCAGHKPKGVAIINHSPASHDEAVYKPKPNSKSKTETRSEPQLCSEE
jgi:cold shock CspA family protein